MLNKLGFSELSRLRRAGLLLLAISVAIGAGVILVVTLRQPAVDFSQVSESTWAYVYNHSYAELSASIDSLSNTESVFEAASGAEGKRIAYSSEYPRLDQDVSDLAHIVAGLANENIIWYEHDLPGIHEIVVSFYLRDGAGEEGTVNRYDLSLHTLDPAEMLDLASESLPPGKTYLYLRVTPELRDEEAVSVSWVHPDLQGYPESFAIRDMSPREAEEMFYMPRRILGRETDYSEPTALVNAVVKNILDAYENPARFIAPYLVHGRVIPLGPQPHPLYNAPMSAR